MTETVVSLRYTFTCLRCGHEWAEEKDVAAPGIEYAPPMPPTRCEECQQRLTDRHAWGRTFEVTEVKTFE